MKFLLGYFYIFTALAGCQTLSKDDLEKDLKVKIYVGDSKRQGLAQTPKDEILSCTRPEFDQMICMTGADFSKLIKRLLDAQCPTQPTE
jgi:hypothetical protein